MSCAYAAGLLGTNRDPRSLTLPRIQDDALAYLIYLLRGVDFEGTQLDNLYAASVGLEGRLLEERLASLPGLRFQRQGDLQTFDWSYAGLAAWGHARLLASAPDVLRSPLEGTP